MKVLSIGSDRGLFISGSESQKRIRDYGTIFKELHIVVFADRRLGYANLKLSDNVFVYPTNHRFRFLYLWNIYKTVSSLKSKVISSRNEWVVSCQDPFEAGIAGWMVKLFFKLPLQIQIHTDVFSPFFSAESFGNRLRVLCAKFLLPRADGIRVVSERIKTSLKLNVSGQLSNVVVLPVFVDVKKIQSAKIKINLHEKYPDYDFIFLMASRLTKEKNINMAIEAMKNLRQRSNVKGRMLLLIVGDGPEAESYKSLVKSYKLENNIAFEPFTDPAILFSYYKTADAFLLTSNYEGYGRTAVEAMAAGLPVIMTDVGVAHELLIDDLDGVVIQVGDIEGLIDGVSFLIDFREKREDFIRNSSAAVATFPDKSEYLNMYKDSLNL